MGYESIAEEIVYTHFIDFISMKKEGLRRGRKLKAC